MLKRFLRSCSMILVLVMLVNMLPMSSLAVELDKIQADQTVTAKPDNVTVTEEIVSKRTEFSKEFRLSNGLHMTAVYDQAVHYQKNGSWEEIDNTLKANLDGTYTNTAGLWSVSLPQKISKDKAITITKDGHTLSFYMAGELRDPVISGPVVMAQAAEAPTMETVADETVAATIEETVSETAGVIATEQTEAETVPETTQAAEAEETPQAFSIGDISSARGQIQKVDLTQARQAVAHEALIAEKNSSRLLYEDVYGNTNIQYDLQSNRVKESVIIEQYSSTLRGYRYTLNTGSMVPQLQQDGSIHFVDGDNRIVMVMPAPFLVDDALFYNYDIDVSLTGSNGIYTLTYLLPKQWLAEEERAWPVVLDPVIAATTSVNNIQDRTISPVNTFSHTSGVITVGYYPRDGVMRFFLKYNNLPTLKSSDVIVHAELTLHKPNNFSKSAVVQVHKVNETWESSTVNWNDYGNNYNEKIEDFLVSQNSGAYTFDVTDIVRDWYTVENTGMMFRADDATENGGVSNYQQFYSSDWGYSGNMPNLVFSFRNNNGLEGYWDYTASSAGRAGTGYVNSYTGNLVWVRSDMGFGGNRMPVSISHVYNLNDSENNDFGAGYGWRTNFNQQVYIYSTNNNYYVWEDSDGTHHYFLYSSSSTYKDEDGLELTLKTNGSGTKKYSITDKNGNVSYFDSHGRLSFQENNQQTKSTISVTYTTSSGKLIDKVTDGVGRVYDFTYDSNEMLSKIEYFGSGTEALATTSFVYSNGNLTEIIDTDNDSCSYAYNDHVLITANDVDTYKLTYSYLTRAATYQPYRVEKVTEFDGSVEGGSLTFEYAHNQTTFTDRVGNVQIMQFNDFGNAVSIQDGLGRAQYAEYAKKNDSDTGKGNQLTKSYKLQNTVGNMVSDSSFEDGNSWTGGSVSTGNSYYGSKSLSVSNATAQGASFTAEAGAAYTFSAYVKTEGDSTAQLSLGGAASEVLPKNSGWTRLEVTFSNETGTSVTVSPKIIATGTVYMDCVQVERSPTASRYNLVEGGDFRYASPWTATGTATGDGIYTADTLSAAAPELDATVYKLTGAPTARKYLEQNVNISGAEGDSFVLSGWAKGDSASLRSVNDQQRTFGLKAIFHYTDGTTSEALPSGTTDNEENREKQRLNFTASFNPDADSQVNWQYTAKAIVAEKDYSSVTVQVLYDYNVNTAYFDGIQLYKEQFGSSYTYDEDGNVTSVVDLQNQRTDYEYDTSGNLTKILQDNKAKMTYEYDSYHNVTKATSEEGLIYQFAYDAYGNNTSVTISGGEQTISSTADYTDDGNRLESTTDALGKQTLYSYDADTNVLDWVRYPKDTEDTQTEYDYDNMCRMASAQMTVDTDTLLSAAYTYEDDLLTKIETGSTTYSFAYGNFALRSSIQIGTRTLANYSYDSQKRLSALDYGNGYKVQYEYDTQGRIVKETYLTDGENPGDMVTYKYDNSGALATVTDSASGISTTYYYDFTDRMMKYVETGTDFTHSVGYSYDKLNNLTSLVETIQKGVAVTEHITTYAYDDDNRTTSVTVDGTTVDYAYDAFGRSNQQTTKHGETAILTDTFTFTAPSAQATSTQVSGHTVSANDEILTRAYTYDDNGNILTIVRDGEETKYTYDAANQLVREDNERLDFTQTWEYDNAGNILSNARYAYTTGSLEGLTPTAANTYSYGDDHWGDLMTAYNGQAITYDEIGNPASIGSRSFTWQNGRQLASQTYNGSTWTYSYNNAGLRTSRSNGSVTYHYIYNGDKLTQMTIVDEVNHTQQVMDFTYDANGQLLTMTYGEEVYYYILSLQGDVAGITDSQGNRLIDFHYEGYGAGYYTSYDTEKAALLAQINPFGYRSYVMDLGTGFYYLQSRYYDPTLGRFINADNQLSAGSDLTGLNLFAYCGNNPVNRIDPTGEAWWHWALGAVVVVACAVATVVTCGGFAAAATAVCMVGSGVAATTAASTVAAAAFIGSATVYGTAVLNAASNSSSIGEFNAQGSWGTVTATVGGALLGGYAGYSMSKPQQDNTTPTYVSRGSTGRTVPYDLKEKLAMEQVQAAPLDGAIPLQINMTDPRWPATEGWIKMANNVNGVEIHFVYNTIIRVFDDFKFKG